MKTYVVNFGQIGTRRLTMSQIETLYLSSAGAKIKPIKKGFKLTLSFHVAVPTADETFYRFGSVQLPPSYSKRFPPFD